MFTLKKRDPTELPFEVLEQAHWRPREVQLCEKHKPEDRKGKEFLRLRNLWRQKEVFINFALNSLLMSLTSKELATLANNLSGRKFSPETGLFGGYSQALKKTIGVPDFILSDGDAAVLGETKLADKFGFDQFVKYQSFAMMCRAATRPAERVQRHSRCPRQNRIKSILRNQSKMEPHNQQRLNSRTRPSDPRPGKKDTSNKRQKHRPNLGHRP